VSVETFNAMADGMQPGMRTVAKSVTEGIVEGMKSAGPEEPSK
jgi:DNA polymerase I-like protein with 3'-5' exonuclease and polymerase domains